MTPAILDIENLRRFVESIPADGLSGVRVAALQRLQYQPLPSTRDEDWKYTDLGPALRIGNRFLAAQSVKRDDQDSSAIADAVCSKIEANWLVIANGRIDLSRYADTKGVTVERFSESRAPEVATDALSSLNQALLHDGLRLHIDGSVETPIGILVVDSSDHEANMSQVNIEIEFASGSDAELIEYHASSGSGDHYCNSITTVRLGESAKAAIVGMQDRSRSHMSTRRVDIEMGRNSILDMGTYDLGAGIARSDINISISNPGSRSMVHGLYLAGRDQHIDNHVTVDHRVGPAESSQDFRGILDGNGRGVWNGKAIVHQGADGTDANQANHNLLLSEKAEIDAKPELEIYADEVKCSHGTTVGQLDETALFYLRTRGLDRETAQQVLIHAFAKDPIRRAPVAAVVARILELVEGRLNEFTEEQR